MFDGEWFNVGCKLLAINGWLDVWWDGDDNIA
jgi:hypothetical protein